MRELCVSPISNYLYLFSWTIDNIQLLLFLKLHHLPKRIFYVAFNQKIVKLLNIWFNQNIAFVNFVPLLIVRSNRLESSWNFVGLKPEQWASETLKPLHSTHQTQSVQSNLGLVCKPAGTRKLTAPEMEIGIGECFGKNWYGGGI